MMERESYSTANGDGDGDGGESMFGFNESNNSNKRKQTSTVWKSFKKVKNPNGEVVAICDHCSSSFVGDSGTSNLRNHLKRKHKEVFDNLEASSNPNTYKFDQERSRKDLATMLVKHNYPLSMVDHKYFKRFSQGLNPEFIIHTQNTLRSDIINLYKEEKEEVYDFLESLSYKVTITTDIWTSDHQNIAYICLTAHFIDDNWELKHKLLAYRDIEYPHDGNTLFKFIRDLLLEWNIDSKLFAIVVDNASSNDVMVRKLRSCLQERSLLSLKGELFHVRCSAHILILVVQDGLKVVQVFLEKIRSTVRYLRNSTYAKQKFDICVNHVRFKGPKVLPIDVPHRWNSTYLMLDTAISMKDALQRLHYTDSSYHHYPSEEDWEVATTVRNCLKGFYSATKHFRGRNFPTSNVFSPDISDLQFDICTWEKSTCEYLREFVGPMKEKFAKYWDECSLVLALGIVFDPKFKLKIVEFHYNKIYGTGADTYVDRICKALDDLYQEYNNITHGGIHEHDTHHCTVQQNDQYSAFDIWLKEGNPRGEQRKSEVDTYLDDPLFPRVGDFCLLQWWKLIASKYPVISRIARDVLAVPATTIASELAFSVGGRTIDETRSSMVPELVEALITTNDWIE